MSDTRQPKEPVAEIKHGPLLASIWPNDAKDGSRFYTVTIGRLWKGDGKKWQQSQYFREKDLTAEGLCALSLLAKARIQELMVEDELMAEPVENPAAVLTKTHTSWQGRKAGRD